MSYHDLARRSAQRAAPDTDPDLPVFVERHLALEAEATRSGQLGDPAIVIALATLTVTVAQFAWTALRNIRSDQMQAIAQGSPPPPAPDAQALKRTILRHFLLRQNLPDFVLHSLDSLSQQQLEDLAGVTAEEALALLPEPPKGAP